MFERRGRGDGVEAGARRRPSAVAPSSRRGHREDGASTRPDSARSPPLSLGFGRRAHAWRRCSWAMSSDISLSTSSSGLSPGWDLIIAAILVLRRPWSWNDSAHSANATMSSVGMAEMPLMRAGGLPAKLHLTKSREAPPVLTSRGGLPHASRPVLVLFYPSLALQSESRLQKQASCISVPRDLLCLAES